MEVDQIKPYVTEDQKEQMRENIAVQKALDLIVRAVQVSARIVIKVSY